MAFNVCECVGEGLGGGGRGVTVNNNKTAPDAAVVREINNKPKYKSGHRKQSQNGRRTSNTTWNESSEPR